MTEEAQRELATLNQQLIKVSTLEIPGVVMLGLGLQAKFSEGAEPLLPMLNNPAIVNGFLVAGTAIVLWAVTRILGIFKRRADVLAGRQD
jgi:hypothetical protein